VHQSSLVTSYSCFTDYGGGNLLLTLRSKLTRVVCCSSGSAAQRGLWPPCHTRFRDHKQRRATVGRTPLGRVISSSQRPLPDNKQHTNIHAPGEIRIHDRSRRATVDLRLRPCGHWDRQTGQSGSMRFKCGDCADQGRC
jgi:hypothetical protein